jgi:hypothetical protein
MGIRIKNGTPVFGESPCESCTKSHIERGFRESEERVYCEATYYTHRVLFHVRECNGYVEKRRQTLSQMEDVAWILTPRGCKRKAGFVPASELRKQEDGDGIELILSDEK